MIEQNAEMTDADGLYSIRIKLELGMHELVSAWFCHCRVFIKLTFCSCGVCLFIFCVDLTKAGWMHKDGMTLRTRFFSLQMMLYYVSRKDRPFLVIRNTGPMTSKREEGKYGMALVYRTIFSRSASHICSIYSTDRHWKLCYIFLPRTIFDKVLFKQWKLEILYGCWWGEKERWRSNFEMASFSDGKEWITKLRCSLI